MEIKNKWFLFLAVWLSNSWALTGVLEPQQGTMFSPGAEVTIHFDIIGGDPVDGVIISVGHKIYSIDGSPPYDISHIASSALAGRVNIYARTIGGDQGNYDGSTYFIIQPSVAPLSLEATPSTLVLDQPEANFPIRVRAVYDNGTKLNVSSRYAGTTYAIASGTNDVITISEDGLVKLIGAGQDTVLIKHLGVETAIVVKGIITNLSPIITQIDDITLTDNENRTVVITGTDSDGDDLHFSGINIPIFADLVDSGDSTANLTLSPNSGDIGNHTVIVSVTDNGVPSFGDSVKFKVTVLQGDGDGDGIDDNIDMCPGTVVGEPVDVSGCSISQLCPCEGTRYKLTIWKNNGKYVYIIAKK